LLRGYCAITTRRVVAAATVAWGLVTAQVTAVATFEHEYHDPAAASCALRLEPAAGVESMVKVTESRLLGVEALRLYFTELTT
jgi:hypothetical protein